MRTILIALDGSSRAAGVMRAGVEIARPSRARVILFRAIAVPPEFPAAAANASRDALPAYLEKQAELELATLAQTASDLECDISVEQSVQPWRAILAAADLVGADLIVLGSHGYHGWDRLLGTTASRVANLAQRNVLVVHEPGGGGGSSARGRADT